MGGPNWGFHVDDSYQEVALLADRMILLSRQKVHQAVNECHGD